MQGIKKISATLGICVFAALLALPMFAAADVPTSATDPAYYGTNTQPASGSNTLPASGSNTSPTYTGSNTQPTSGGNSVGGISNPLQFTSICSLLKAVLNIAMLLGAPFAMLFIVYAGFKLVLARGNPEELKRAKLNLMYTLLGIAIFIGVWTFVNLLANTLGSLGVQILGDCR